MAEPPVLRLRQENADTIFDHSFMIILVKNYFDGLTFGLKSPNIFL